ncbi:hypothetical protein H2200_004162 [Cladophialophora chaetospira]|uniref:Ubiquitin-like domain-containing protein n=1 Tax=Cladophialophora chaetospira TaxID=386627 RepID=A0AA38XFK7_9EURO|nr:hypothetical protein H2200_004162 [Cladophialophora chaetospira]
MFAPVGGLGDVLALSKLIYQIGLELKSIPESAPEYQDLVNELEALDRALKDIYQIRPGVHELKRLDGIRALASTCQIPLQEFLGKIQKFNKSLGPWNCHKTRLNGFGRGLQWSLIWKEEVRKLRSKLTPKLNAILILLTSQIVESLAKAESDRASIGNDISTKLSLQQFLLERLETKCATVQSDATTAHAKLTNAVHSQSRAITELHVKTENQKAVIESRLVEQGVVLEDIQHQTIATGDQVNIISMQVVSVQQDLAQIKADTGSVLDFMARMWKFTVDGFSRLHEIAELITDLLRLTVAMTKETMETMLRLLREIKDIRQQLICIERYMPMQVHYPMIYFRDAFNDVNPLPYHVFRQWEGAKRMVAAIFVNRQGLRRVETGQWFVTHVKKGVRVNPRFWDKAIQPGDELSMTMIFDDVQAKEGCCPYPSCGADISAAEVVRGGRFCPQCSRFSQLSQDRIHNTDGASVNEAEATHDGSSLLATVQVRKSLPVEIISDPGPLPPDAPEAPQPTKIGHDDIDEYHFVQVVQMSSALEVSPQDILGQEREQNHDFAFTSQPQEGSSEYITIFVHELGQKSLCFRLLKKTTIHDIRTIVSERKDIPGDRQRLSFGGKALEDDMTLSSVGIEDGNTLRLVQRVQSPSDATVGIKDDVNHKADVGSEDIWDFTSLTSNADESSSQSTRNTDTRRTSERKTPIPDYYSVPSPLNTKYAPYQRDQPSYYSSRYQAPLSRPTSRASYRTSQQRYNYEPTYMYGGATPAYIYRDTASTPAKDSAANSYFYYGQEEPVERRTRPRRPSASITSRPTTRKRSTAPAPTRKATEEDARRHKIPAGYSLKNWDPTEEPIMLLGSVFDANSLGKWIYDWTVYHHGSATPMADMAGELWLLLIKLAGNTKRSEETMPKIQRAENRETVEDYLESSERLWNRLKKLLKECEHYMLKTRSKKEQVIGMKAGTEFVDSIFGRDRFLERTEKLMNGMRLWNMRFEVNCADILRTPSMT